LSLFTSREFLAISFDASGATTGALTVPFILALAIGVTSLKKDSKASEKDSFGLVAIASVGAILGVIVMSILSKGGALTGNLPESDTIASSIIGPFLRVIPKTAVEVFIALLPVISIFLILQRKTMRLSQKRFRRILIGVLFAFTGLVLFLSGVNAGFMSVGSTIGYRMASFENKAYILITAFVMGLFTVISEPAVHVLTQQIEDVTSGYVKRSVVMATLAIGVAFAVVLSMIRILIPAIQLWHYLLPGYILSILMSFYVPKLFVGIAFDAGGVASGPMTATFILAFAHGAAEAAEGASVLVDGFGIIAMVAMTPIIALQTLGFIYRMKTKRREIKNV